jgi:hypothetical protein
MTDEWRVRYLAQSRHDWYEAARRFMTHHVTSAPINAALRKDYFA